MTPPGTVVTLMPVSQGFAAASGTWLSLLLADRRLTHAEKTLASRLFLYVERKHFEATGQLLAYPGWERLQEETTLTERSIARGVAKLESSLPSSGFSGGGSTPRPEGGVPINTC